MKKIIILCLFAIFLSPTLFAQDILTSRDLSTVKVDNLSETDISRIKSQLQINNLTVEQAEPIALAKGMSPLEFAKLKVRLSAESAVVSTDKNAEQTRTQEIVVNNKTKNPAVASIFGSDLFDNPTLNFEPNLKLATPVNYILGPGDELQVSVYGVQEFNTSAPVTVEGNVIIQYVGQIPVAGITIEAATQKIRNAFAKIYSTVRSGQSKVGVSLSRIRTIKITIIGSRQPGNYSVSSLSTVYNALFVGGGPGNNGSYRNIELIRDNKIFKNIDIYKFLVNGDQSDNIGLKDNDVIRIPVYTNRVTLEGQVNRPGIFELKPGEKFVDLLSFASGFTEIAYRAGVSIIQKTSKEFKVVDLRSSEFSTYIPLPGDVIRISEILNRFENRIKISGAVFRPDVYSYTDGMRISDLIARADGVKEDAYTKRVTIVRLKSDLTSELVNIDLSRALSGDTAANVLLKREDQVTVYSILDFEEDYNVIINGEIKRPGTYTFRENLSLNDLLIQAGGLLGSASSKVEIARMIKADDIDDNNPVKAELFNLQINTLDFEQVKNFELQPFDVINVRKMSVYEKPQMVSVTGPVAKPGIYVLAYKNEKVLDVIKRAGGLTSTANFNGVKIKRPIQAREIEELENVDINLGKNDSVQNKLSRKLREEVKFSTIPVDYTKITANPLDNENVSLQAGDEIDIAVKTESVKVQGNVLLNSEIPHVSRKGFKYYINAVGGLDSKAWKKKAYIIYPNGKAAVTSSFLFFRSYPKVTPGSQIVVPERPEVNRITMGEIVSIASVLVGMAGVVIAILR